MTKFVYYFIFLFLLSNQIISQDTLYKITGTVIDDKTKLPLDQVSVQVSGSLRGTTTDSNGKFKFSLKEKELVLKFSMIGYEDKFVNLNYKSYKQITVSLIQSTQQLNEISISSSNIQTIVKDKEYNVLDYDFYEENILLITYKNDLQKSKLILLSEAFDTLSKIPIPEEPKAIFKDCIGNHHIVCEKNSYQIFINVNKLELLDPQDIKKFESILYPCVAEDSLNYYIYRKYNAGIVTSNDWHNFKTNNHTIVYTSANKTNKQKKDFAIIVDEKSNKMRETEADFEAKTRRPDDERVFFETSVTKEVFAPLYKINNTLYVFDYLNSFIKTFSSNGKMTQSVPISFHKELKWKREMCVDEKTGKAFAIFESNGITELKEINLNTGEINQTYKIPFSYIKNIKAHDDYIYFLDRDMGYDETKYLSRLKLN